jgi:hypothetical protein
VQRIERGEQEVTRKHQEKGHSNVLDVNSGYYSYTSSGVIEMKPVGPFSVMEPLPQYDQNNMAVGRKYDAGKARFDLMPATAELKIAGVLKYGACKYAPDNWRKVENPEARYLAAALRHINAWRRGEKRDPESGLSHLAHAATSLMFVIELVSDEHNDV